MNRAPQEVLPTGIIALLLADIEGSTRLWQERPEAMTAAMALLDRLLAKVVGHHNGFRPVEQGEGDSFVIAFTRATEALKCALELQRTPLSPVRLRIGVHTGETQLRDAHNYVGPTINRAARLRDLAHGGQTVLSAATYDLVADQLPPDVWLSDLGTHRLRDLPRPERVFQVCHPDLRVDFPPLRSRGATRRHFPMSLTSFIGRRDQLKEIRLLVSANRLVTLTGAGGIGKTRLAMQVAALLAAAFDAGVWFVDLAPVTDPDNVASAAAGALNLPDEPGRASIDTLADFIDEHQVLIVLDNCEHLLGGATAAAVALLSACPNLTILATSRQPLSVPGEVVCRVPPLSVADEAIELFIERARQRQPEVDLCDDDLALVAQICRRLDGMPLAIELAAACLCSMSLAEIVESLNDRLRVLRGSTSTSVPRQQTLWALVDWSHALLTETERVVFRRLALFRGGFDLAAAQAVAGGVSVDAARVLSDLIALVDKSLVLAETSHRRTQYRLRETVRQYAQEKLAEAGETNRVGSKHRDHYAAVAAMLDDPVGGVDERLIDQINTDFTNMRAAFRWSREKADAAGALVLVSALQPLWLGRSRFQEGLEWFQAVLKDDQAMQTVTPPVRARALADMALLTAWTGAGDGGQAEQALQISREVDDPFLLTRVLNVCGAINAHDLKVAAPYFEEAVSIARRIGDKRQLVQILSWHAYSTFLAGDPIAMRGAAEEGRDLAESIGNGLGMRRCGSFLTLAQLISSEMDTDTAIARLRQYVAETEAAGDLTWRAINLIILARILAYQGDAQAAVGTAKIAIDATARLGSFCQGLAYGAMTAAALSAGDVALANSAISAGLLKINVPKLAVRCSVDAAEAALARGDLDEASRCAEWAVSSTTGWHLSRVLTTCARIALAQGDYARAERDVYEALTHSVKVEAYLGIPDTLECLAVVVGQAGAHARAARLFGAAEAIRQANGERRFPNYEASYGEAVSSVRDMLGSDDFTNAWSEGFALSVDEVIAYAQRRRGERKRPSSGWESLTPTEHDVVRFASEGLTNKDIATRLFVSPRTVQAHLTHVYSKLGLHSRVQLAQEASRRAADPS